MDCVYPFRLDLCSTWPCCTEEALGGATVFVMVVPASQALELILAGLVYVAIGVLLSVIACAAV